MKIYSEGEYHGWKENIQNEYIRWFQEKRCGSLCGYVGRISAENAE